MLKMGPYLSKVNGPNEVGDSKEAYSCFEEGCQDLFDHESRLMISLME